MIAAVLSVWALLLGISLLMAGGGLQGTLLGLRATSEGFPVFTTGIVMSSYYAGAIAGSLLTPHLIRNVGPIRVFGALASLASITALTHVVLIDPYIWTVLRALTGFCYIGLYIVAESWLNARSTNQSRGQLLSIYMIVMTGSMAGGPLLLNFGNPAGFDLFILASILVSLAVIPVALTTYGAPEFGTQERFGIRRLLETSPLGALGCLVHGAASGALIWLASVYGGSVGMSVQSISILTAASILGGTILVWPIGRLSDRFDRRMILTITALAGGGVSLVAALIGSSSNVLIPIAAAAVIGSFVMPTYSLSIAHTNDHLEPSQLVAAASGLLLITGVGGMIGPAAAGGVMAVFGSSGYFLFPAFVLIALGLFGLFRMSRRPSLPNDDQRDFVQVPRTTSVGTRIALRDQMDRDLGFMARR